MLTIKKNLFNWFKSFFLILPLMISFWRGIWDLLTYYFSVFPKPLNFWIMSFMGSLFIFAYFVYPFVYKSILNSNERFRGVLTTSTLYFGSLFLQAAWRGVWGLADHYLDGLSIKLSLIIFLCGYSFLSLLGVSRSLIFPPFIIHFDDNPGALIPTTRFHVKPEKNVLTVISYVLDCIFTHFVILPVSIVTWRCGIYIVSFLCADPVLRDIICLVSGLALSLLLIFLEILICKLVSHYLEISQLQITQRSENGAFGDNYENEASLSRSLIEDIIDEENEEELERWILNNDLIFNSPNLRNSISQSHHYSDIALNGKAPANTSFSMIEKLKMLLFEDTVFFIVFVVEVILWTGGWNLDSRFILGDSLLGAWVSHVIAVVGLYATGTMSFVGACGCMHDGNLSRPFSQSYENFYFITYFSSNLERNIQYHYVESQIDIH